jgi:CRISPR system Cascade subunit CasC
LADQPISLANAFERPFGRDEMSNGFLQPSIARIAAYWGRINRAYGLKEQARAFAVEESVMLDGQPAMDSLAGLEQWIAADGKD